MMKPWYVCGVGGVTQSMKQLLSCCLWSEVNLLWNVKMILLLLGDSAHCLTTWIQVVSSMAALGLSEESEEK